MLRKIITISLLLLSLSVIASEGRKFDYFYYEGLKLKQAGKYDAAYDMFSYCLSMDSTAASVLYEMSSFYAQMNKADKAVEMLRKAVKRDSNNMTYRLALANVSASLGMYADAAAEYEALVSEYPDKAELRYYLAEAFSKGGETTKAIEAYDALEGIMGVNEDLPLQKYKLYLSINEDENAFAEIKKLADKYPAESRYQLQIGDWYLERGKTEEALKSYQKAHEINPSDPLYIVAMANYYEVTGNKEAAEKEVYNALVNKSLDIESKVGILSRYIQRLQQTKQSMEQANTLFRTLLEQHPQDTNLKLMYGSLLMLQQKNDEAKFQFTLVTEMEPTNQGAWQQLLSLALKTENIDEIVRVCEKCIELFPESPEYYFYLGIGYFQQEKYDKSLETYYKGVNIIPKTNGALISDFYGQIGDIYYQKKNMSEAYKAYDEALKYNENNVVVLNNYSYFLTLEKRDLKRAERMSAQCIKLEPDNSTYLDTYAWVFFMQGSYKLAKIYIENAISKDKTNSAELIDHYGDILYMSGEKDKAMEQWKKAKEMGKSSEILDRKIKEGVYIEDKNM